MENRSNVFAWLVRTRRVSILTATLPVALNQRTLVFTCSCTKRGYFLRMQPLLVSDN